MAWHCEARRWRGLAAVGAIASLVVAACFVSPSRGDDKSTGASTDAKAKPAKASGSTVDPFAVPDGSTQELLTFMGKMRTMRTPRKLSPADAQAFVVKRNTAVVAAADKILALDPEAKIRLAALQAKLPALAALDDSGDDHAGTNLASLVDELKNDKQPGIAKLAKRYAAQAADVASASTAKKLEVKASHLDGTPFDPASIKGKVALVELWRTNCGACRAEMPNLARDYAKYYSRGFEVVSISVDTDKAEVEKFLKENPSIKWQVLFAGSTGGMTIPGEAGGNFAIPKMVLVNRRGAIVSEKISDAELTAKLAELLGP